MRTMTATWSGEKLGFSIGNDRLPAVRIDADEPAPLGFDRGHMPTELLLGAFGGCVGMNATALLRKRKLPLAGLSVTVSGEQSPEWPKPFVRIELLFTLTWDAAPDDELVDAMLEKAVHAYCPVGSTLSPDVVVTMRREDVRTDG